VSRAVLIAVVALSAFGVLSAAMSVAVAAWWRLRLAAASPASPVDRARQVFWWRMAPAAVALSATLLVVVPAFAIFEPLGHSETGGPFLIAFAVAAVTMLGASFGMALRSAVDTHLALRRWLRTSAPLNVDPPAGMPAVVIHSAAPVVALVGIFRPRLVATHAVIAACTAGELNAIVSHERGHWRSRDNLKRWLMACVPDLLTWTPLHRQMTSAWHQAAEDAADDVSTDGSDAARTDLAALLIKIARLTPERGRPLVAISPFVEEDGLSRRVTRLLAQRPAGAPSWSAGPIAAGIGAAVIVTVLSSPVLMRRVFDAVETFVALGR
jgi:Zn-dependent protease with chaperone function